MQYSPRIREIANSIGLSSFAKDKDKEIASRKLGTPRPPPPKTKRQKNGGVNCVQYSPKIREIANSIGLSSFPKDKEIARMKLGTPLPLLQSIASNIPGKREKRETVKQDAAIGAQSAEDT